MCNNTRHHTAILASLLVYKGAKGGKNNILTLNSLKNFQRVEMYFFDRIHWFTCDVLDCYFT